MSISEPPKQTTTLTIDEALQQAIVLQQSGRLQGAEQLYRAILNVQPSHPDANHNLGVLAMQVKQPVAGLSHLKNALEVNPNQAQYWLSYVEALIQSNQLDEALQVFQQARQQGLQGDVVENLAKRLRGRDRNVIHMENQCSSIELPAVVPPRSKYGKKNSKTKSKKNNFSKVTLLQNKRNPSQQEVNTLLAKFQEGRFEEAVSLAQTMTERFPQFGLGWKVLGTVFKLIGRSADALLPMQQAVILFPDDVEIHNNLGVTLNDLRQFEEAEACYRRALEIKPDYAEAHYNLGITLNDMGRYEEAESSFRCALEIKPDYAEAHSNLGVTLNDLGRFKEAESSFRRALAIKPAYVEAHNNLGSSLNSLGRFEEAEASFRLALEVKPDSPKAHNNLGIALNGQSRFEEAKASFRRALEIQPEDAEALSNLGVTLKSVGCIDEAETSFRRSLQIKPDYAEAHYNLGNTLKESGRLAEAEASFRRALEINANAAESYINLGVLFTDMGRLSEARSCFWRGLDVVQKGKERIAAMALTICWITGLYSEAKTLVSKYARAIHEERENRSHTQHVFFIYIAKMLEHKTAHPELYEREGNVSPLIVLGDSHSLGPNNMEFEWIDGVRVSASSRFVFGVKMHHLAEAKKKNYSIALSEHLKSIKPYSHLLFTIGEIDCRPDEGIWVAAHKKGIPLAEVITKTVEGYLNWIAIELARYTFASVSIQGIPAPNYCYKNKYHLNDKEGFVGMIRDVNQQIESGALSRGWKFLNVYLATSAEDGISHGKWHLDSHHLQPLYYKYAVNWFR